MNLCPACNTDSPVDATACRCCGTPLALSSDAIGPTTDEADPAAEAAAEAAAETEDDEGAAE